MEVAVDIQIAAEGNDSLSETLLDVLILTRIITVSHLKREEALRQDLNALTQNIRAFIEEVVEDHVDFQFYEFDKHNKEALNHISKQIESLNVRMDRPGDNA